MYIQKDMQARTVKQGEKMDEREGIKLKNENENKNKNKIELMFGLFGMVSTDSTTNKQTPLNLRTGGTERPELRRVDREMVDEEM